MSNATWAAKTARWADALAKGHAMRFETDPEAREKQMEWIRTHTAAAKASA